MFALFSRTMYHLSCFASELSLKKGRRLKSKSLIINDYQGFTSCCFECS